MNQNFYRRLGNVVIIVACIVTYQFMTMYRSQEQEIANLSEQVQMLKNVSAKASEAEVQAQNEAGNYQDGEYTGEAQGFGGPVKVKVRIAGSKIAEVSIVSAEHEDAAYLDMAKVLLDTIVTEQSLEVDAISGATYSSNGIIDAAKQAVEQAVIK